MSATKIFVYVLYNVETQHRVFIQKKTLKQTDSALALHSNILATWKTVWFGLTLNFGRALMSKNAFGNVYIFHSLTNNHLEKCLKNNNLLANLYLAGQMVDMLIR